MAKAAWVVVLSACGAPREVEPPRDVTPASRERWRLVHHETFDAPFPEPPWTEDRGGDHSPYHVDVRDDDGAFFVERGGAAFTSGLAQVRGFRRAVRYGADGWLTVEAYGRDDDGDGVPDSGGRLVAERGIGHLVSRRHTDGVLLRSTEPLPPRYRVEVTIANIAFGGARDGDWTYDGRINGYDGDERAGPWSFRDGDPTPRSAVAQNGMYFLCITDYARPAPHNNVFLHHHRKVVMDTDSNGLGVAADTWSKVWNPATGRGELDGSRYVSMLWLDGSSPGHDWFGNAFVSYTPGGWATGDDLVFTDQYLEGEAYTFAVERDGEAFTLEASGRFRHGGRTTYRASRRFTDPPVTWHHDQVAYPDHFIIGDPHINYYEGSADLDDVRLYVPAGDAPPATAR
jgi:hypothetical protein